MSQKPVTHTPEPWAYEAGQGKHEGKIVITAASMPASSPLAHVSNICDDAEPDARRIVACVNQLEEFTTEELEQKPIGQLMAERAFLASAGPDAKSGGFAFNFEGGACGIMAAAFAGQLVGTGAPNFIEISFSHPEIDGLCTVTIQRANGKTPGQLRSEAVAQRDNYRNLCDELIDVVKDLYWQADGRSQAIEALIDKAHSILGEQP